MEFLPLFLKTRGRKAVVLGGGHVAARKVDVLLRAGCEITVIAPDLDDELADLLAEGRITHKPRPIEAADLEGCVVAIGATDDRNANRHMYELANAAGVPVNIVDSPDECDFIMPAIVDRSPIIIAVSSSGTTPLLTRLLRARIETAIPAAYGRLAEFAGGYRDRVRKAITDSRRRMRFWQAMTDGPVAEYVLAGKQAEAAALADKLLAEAAARGDAPTVGEVYLVGAGPGDPDLLTFRALRLMQQADVVLYDRLIGDGILDMVRRDAEHIYVGKMSKDHTLPQEDISDLLVRLAKEGKRVLRLKAGDPFMFGRGGEEIEALAGQGIAFQVVPGITAANGCASYAGIPLTHRDHAQSCIFVTGHGKDGKLDLNWDTLVQPKQTVAIYMGLASLRQICGAFISHGASTDLPAAIIENGTREGQRVITGTLATLPDAVDAAGVKGPAMTIIGTVVNLRDNLNWFEAD